MTNYIGPVILFLSDVAVLWAFWRVRGKPLPKRLLWLRSAPYIGWAFRRLALPVPGRF